MRTLSRPPLRACRASLQAVGTLSHHFVTGEGITIMRLLPFIEWEKVGDRPDQGSSDVEERALL